VREDGLVAQSYVGLISDSRCTGLGEVQGFVAHDQMSTTVGGHRRKYGQGTPNVRVGEAFDG